MDKVKLIFIANLALERELHCFMCKGALFQMWIASFRNVLWLALGGRSSIRWPWVTALVWTTSSGLSTTHWVLFEHRLIYTSKFQKFTLQNFNFFGNSTFLKIRLFRFFVFSEVESLICTFWKLTFLTFSEINSWGDNCFMLNWFFG